MNFCNGEAMILRAKGSENIGLAGRVSYLLEWVCQTLQPTGEHRKLKSRL
jgi:hypothetical protein